MPLSPTEDQKTQIMVVKICETDLQLKLVQNKTIRPNGRKDFARDSKAILKSENIFSVS